MKFNLSKSIILTVLSLLPVIGFGQSTGNGLPPELPIYAVLALVFMVALVILGVTYNVYNIIRTVVSKEEERKALEQGTKYVPEPSWWTKLMSSWTRATPVEKEASITLDHEYDGIRELDNHLPPWWLALFYGSIVFAAVYLFGYHVMGWWPLQEEEYEIAMARAAEVQAARTAEEGAIDENAIEYNSDPIFLGGGETVFEQSCATCHRADGGGMVGPNLTDNYWIHGGTPSDIYKVIKNGVPAKGMASWEKALTPQKIAQVTSYIISLNGTNPPDAKAPQGDLVEPAVMEEVDGGEVENTETEDESAAEQQ